MKEKNLIHKLWDGTKVYLVHGKDIRDDYDTKFIGGGHGYRYDYVPKDEMWLEIQEDREDMKEILVHEITEYIFMKYEGKNYDDSHNIANIIEDTLRAIPDNSEKPLPSEPPQEEGKDDPIEPDGSKIKVSFIVHMPGHKDSSGKAAPYVIKSHNTNEILSSHGSRGEAEKHLKQMKYFKHKKGEKYSFFRRVPSIEELLKNETILKLAALYDQMFDMRLPEIPKKVQRGGNPLNALNEQLNMLAVDILYEFKGQKLEAGKIGPRAKSIPMIQQLIDYVNESKDFEEIRDDIINLLETKVNWETNVNNGIAFVRENDPYFLI